MRVFLIIPGRELPLHIRRLSARPNALVLQGAMPFSCAFLSLVLCCRASTGFLPVPGASVICQNQKMADSIHRRSSAPIPVFAQAPRRGKSLRPAALGLLLWLRHLRVSVPPKNFAGSAFANFSGPAKKADLRHLGAGPLAQLCYVCPEHIREIKTEKTPCIRTESRSSVF